MNQSLPTNAGVLPAKAANPEIYLFIDDSGSRDPDRQPHVIRNDSMDCFALGGVLINAEDIDTVVGAHQSFCQSQGIDYPLHSWAIRGGRGDFGWLKTPERAREFFPALDDFLLSLPIVGIAAVVHRPGYVARYKDAYEDRLWFMCKTAYCILIERAAKYARSQGRKLRVFFEEAGKHEDRELMAYAKELKASGMPFNQGNSAAYGGLQAADFQDIVLGEPKRRTKKTPMIQIADLVLYPMAKAGYEPSYRPFRDLMARGKVIDALVPESSRSSLGIKYSCFDDLINKSPA